MHKKSQVIDCWRYEGSGDRFCSDFPANGSQLTKLIFMVLLVIVILLVILIVIVIVVLLVIVIFLVIVIVRLTSQGLHLKIGPCIIVDLFIFLIYK